MKHLTLAAASAAVWLTLTAPAWAQPGYVRPQTNPYGQPIVSPYVNLNRGFGNAGINYFGIVRPQLQAQQAFQQLQQQQAYLDQAVAAGITGVDPNQPGTGHGTRFFNYSHYFSNQGSRAVPPPFGGLPPAAAPLFNTPQSRGAIAPPPPTPRPGM
jgi:hypothetical protein